MEIHTPSVVRNLPSLKRFEPVAIDSSALSAFKVCPRKYFYRYVLGFTEADTKIYFTFGTAYHKYREVIEQHFAGGNDYIACHVAGITAANKIWGNTPDPQGGNHRHLTSRRLSETLDYTFKHWKKEKEAKQIVVLHTEMAFNVEIEGTGIFTSGRCDQVIDFAGALWGRDFKTTKDKWEYYQRNLSPSDQFTRYTYAESVLHGKPVKGQLVEVMFNAPEPVKGGKAETYGPAIYAKFVHVPTTRIDEWKNDQRYWDAALAGCREQDLYPMNETACKYCEFRQVCEEPTDTGKLIQLTRNYKHEVWDNSKDD